jgi:ABC-type multidrug transport system ATPase subunit
MTGPFYALPVRSFVLGAVFLEVTSPALDRLRTIISYDRICVMDNGKIVEFGVPEDLYAQDGIFRGMCERSSITLEDIRSAGKEREAAEEVVY